MKRDMELVRNVLLFTEAKTDVFTFEMPVFEGFDRDTVSGHVKLLAEQGLLRAEDMTTMGPGGREIAPMELTWQGHEFLDAIRADTVWRKLKSKVAEKGGSMPFEIVKELATTFAREYFTS